MHTHTQTEMRAHGAPAVSAEPQRDSNDDSFVTGKQSGCRGIQVPTSNLMHAWPDTHVITHMHTHKVHTYLAMDSLACKAETDDSSRSVFM